MLRCPLSEGTKLTTVGVITAFPLSKRVLHSRPIPHSPSQPREAAFLLAGSEAKPICLITWWRSGGAGGEGCRAGGGKG